MRQPRINTSQVQYLLSHKVLFEPFTPYKDYDKSIIIRIGDNLYLSKEVVEGKEEFDENDWIKLYNSTDIEHLIEEERDRAIAVENSLREDLETEILDRIDAIDNLTEALEAEIARAEQAESGLSDLVDAETDRAEAAEQAIADDLSTHINDRLNPHNVTKAQVGLGNCDNTSDLNKPISIATQAALDTKVNKSGDTMTGDLIMDMSDIHISVADDIDKSNRILFGKSNYITADDKNIVGIYHYDKTLGKIGYTLDATSSFYAENVTNTIDLGDSKHIWKTLYVTSLNDGTYSITVDQIYHKVDQTTSANRIYGTDANGNQTTYDYDSFGKVDDVRVGGVSVVTNKIANLGTIASHSEDDYTQVLFVDWS